MPNRPSVSFSVRATAAGVGILLLSLSVLGMRWAMADLHVLGMEHLTAAASDRPDSAEALLQRARTEFAEAEALRGRHPNYLDRLYRVEALAASTYAWPNVVARSAHLREAEALALEAYAAQPLPHQLVRAAYVRAQGNLLDQTFEAHLRTAAEKAPWDSGTASGSLAVLIPRWPVLSEDLRRFALERAERLYESSASHRTAAMLIQRHGLWEAFCDQPSVRASESQRCADAAGA